MDLCMYGPKASVGVHPIRITPNFSKLNFLKANWKFIEKEILRQDWPKYFSTSDIDTNNMSYAI